MTSAIIETRWPAPAHPKLGSLLRYWDGLRRGRPMPARADIDVLALKPWIGNLHLIEFIEDGRDFYYRVFGTNIAGYFGHDFTRRTSAALPPLLRDVIREEYERARRSGAPLLVRRDRTLYGGAARVEKLILPLSADGAAVDMVLVGVFLLHGAIG